MFGWEGWYFLSSAATYISLTSLLAFISLLFLLIYNVLFMHILDSIFTFRFFLLICSTHCSESSSVYSPFRFILDLVWSGSGPGTSLLFFTFHCSTYNPIFIYSHLIFVSDTIFTLLNYFILFYWIHRYYSDFIYTKLYFVLHFPSDSL